MKTRTFEENLKRRTQGIVAVNAAKGFLFSLAAAAILFYLYCAALYVAPGFVPFRVSFGLILGVMLSVPVFSAAFVFFLHHRDTQRLTMTIEHSYPQLRERLLTAVEFSRAPGKLHQNPFSLALARSLEDEMTALMDRFGFGRATSPKKLLIPAALLAVIFVSGAVHATLQPEFFRSLGTQMPSAPASWPGFEAFENAAHRFRFEIIPGNCEIAKGSNLLIQAKITGEKPREVTLYVKQKNDPAWRIFVMESAGDHLFQYRLTYITEQSVYFIKAEDQESLRYQIQLSQALAVEKALWRIHYPEHTNLPDESRQGWGPKITVPVGTRIRLELTMNRSVSSGKLTSDSGGEYRMTPQSDRQLITDFTVMKDELVRMDVRTREGEPMMGAPAVWIQTLPDLLPYLEVLDPQFHNYVFPTEEIPFEINVNDDYGIKSVTLVIRYQGKEERIEWLPEGTKQDKVTLKPVLNMERFKLRSRDLVFAYIEVRDNSPGEPAHIVQSPLFTFLIRDYVEYFKLKSKLPESPSLRMLFEGVLVEQEKIMNEAWDYISRLPGESPKGWEDNGPAESRAASSQKAGS